MTYSVTSFGTLLAMLSYVLEQPALVMFTLLISFGLVAQVAGDATRKVFTAGGFKMGKTAISKP